MYCLGLGFLSLIFMSPFFGFGLGGFILSGGVIIIGFNCGERLGALSGLLFFTLVSSILSHRLISFFSEKILTSCCKATRFPIPISSTSLACADFSKTNHISATEFVIASVVDMKGILVDCGKI